MAVAIWGVVTSLCAEKYVLQMNGISDGYRCNQNYKSKGSAPRCKNPSRPFLRNDLNLRRFCGEAGTVNHITPVLEKHSLSIREQESF